MEFFFLTQNQTLEIIILIALTLLLVGIGSYHLYHWIGRVRIALSTTTRVTNIESRSPVAKSDSNITTEKDPTVAIDETRIEESIENKHDTSQVEKLVWLVSSARTLIARGMMSEARTLIIEWLSLDKHHRDLNLLLGQIYEQDGQYEKSEYIYKDMAEIYPGDIEILEKLANVLIIEKKYIIAWEIYKKILSSTGNTETTLYMLTHISHTLGDTNSTMLYAKQYVLQWPKNPEIITLLAESQVILGMRKDAIETYKNLKNLTPYSSEISETLQKLMIEEELAGNFEVKEV